MLALVVIEVPSCALRSGMKVVTLCKARPEPPLCKGHRHTVMNDHLHRRWRKSRDGILRCGMQLAINCKRNNIARNLGLSGPTQAGVDDTLTKIPLLNTSITVGICFKQIDAYINAGVLAYFIVDQRRERESQRLNCVGWRRELVRTSISILDEAHQFLHARCRICAPVAGQRECGFDSNESHARQAQAKPAWKLFLPMRTGLSIVMKAQQSSLQSRF